LYAQQTVCHTLGVRKIEELPAKRGFSEVEEKLGIGIHRLVAPGLTNLVSRS
jgi:hypothetical protein